ncbi:myb-like protein AA isoform X2 [Condylostylus longicornis]|uniref:myb-like protein AA isoform X2 n=1 Tax=Condylostylus longicornis TaxID=2530218 RepID=UPI00244DE9B4|nr:myb-like protein AA isoform X2 [Condylostylus longicornis]
MPSAFPAKMFPKSEHTELDNYKLQVEILQQKLAKSEEQRQQLEEKFEKIQKKRNENEKSIKARSRAKFEEFLDKQRERNERNKKIIRMLEHIDQQAALLAQRSSRLKAMKRQYELYFARLLQSQAFRIQQAARYSFLPINQYPTLTQPHDYTPMLESKGNIPAITTIPATPPANISPRAQAPIQPIPMPMEMNNWNYMTQSYPGTTKVQNPNFIGIASSDIVPSYNSFPYNMQPNPLEFYKGTALYNYPNPTKVIQNNDISQQQAWDYPSFSQNNNVTSSPRKQHSYSNSGYMKNKPDIDNTIASHRASPSIQRTFKDYDAADQPLKSFSKKNVNEHGATRGEYNYSKATEDDLDLLKKLNLRNRMRTFSDSNENISQPDGNQEQYSRSHRESYLDPYAPVSPTNDFGGRYVPRSSHSRSSSVESKVAAPSNFKQPQQEDNYSSRAEVSEREPLQPYSRFSDMQSSGKNISSERTSNAYRNSDNTESSQILGDDMQRQGDNLKRPQYAEVPASKQYSQHQQYNRQNSTSNLPNINTIPASDTIGSANGTVISNSDKIMLPSKNYKSSFSAYPENGPDLSSPPHYNDDSSAADKKQRPALLKKIQIPDYLSSKSNVEKSERTDADIYKLHQPSGMDPSPIQFAKKEKLKLENIENDIYGDIINPEISMSSGNSNNGVSQVLRQHQTPAEILAQTNQSRKPVMDTFKPQVSSFQNAPQQHENQIEKSDISEKSLKHKIDPPNQRNLNVNLEKLKINEPVQKQQHNIPPTPLMEHSPKINRLPETAIRENITPKLQETSQNKLEEYEPTPQETIPEFSQKMETPEVEKSQINSKPTFDYDNAPSANTENYEQQAETQIDTFSGQDQYQSDADPSNIQPNIDNPEIYPETQNYIEPTESNANVYQEDQQQYDNTQNYQGYDQQNYDQNQQNQYENYQPDNNYQTDYDPNTYDYSAYQQQGDGTYAGYDPNQQYSEQDYGQQGYQDPNYSDQQYNQQEYPSEQNQIDPNQYDYSQQNVPTENYEQQGVIQDQSLVQENKPVVDQQPEPSPIPPPTAPQNNSSPKGQSKSVKPILTKEKSADAKKKRVNFIDSSDESSKTQQQQQPTTTDESDFDFSSQ